MARDWQAEVAAAWAEVDTATTALGARVQKMIDQINATPGDGLNGPQTEALLANLTTLKNNLNAMGADQTVPPAPEFPPIV